MTRATLAAAAVFLLVGCEPDPHGYVSELFCSREHGARVLVYTRRDGGVPPAYVYQETEEALVSVDPMDIALDQYTVEYWVTREETEDIELARGWCSEPR